MKKNMSVVKMKSTLELKELLEEIKEHINRIDEEVDIYRLSDNDYRYMINNLITISLKLKSII